MTARNHGVGMFEESSITQLVGGEARARRQRKTRRPAGFSRNDQTNDVYFFLADFLVAAGSTEIASSST
jgi:hypothetical protein